MIIKKLLNWFGPSAKDTIMSAPAVKGHVTIQLFNKEGKLHHQVDGYNIWTLTGREY